MKEYEGGWAGVLDNPKAFVFTVTIEPLHSAEYHFQCSNGQFIADTSFELKDNKFIHIAFGDHLIFDAILDAQSKAVRGFLQTGIHQYHITLEETSPHVYRGEWNMFFVKDSNPRMLLDIENASGDQYAAYLILGDKRAPRLMCNSFKKNGNQLFFADARLGLNFVATLAPQVIELDIQLVSKSVAKLHLTKQTGNWEPQNGTDSSGLTASYPLNLKDGWEIGDLRSAEVNSRFLQQMEDSINAQVITKTHSVLIARHGKLLYEKYFDGYNAQSPHDLRSAQKSISSALTGIAIDRGYVSSVNLKMYDFIPAGYEFWEKSDSRSREITLRNLLNMSSGIDAVDFGTDRESPASEDAYQQTDDWLKTVLAAPMLNDPGTHANYGSANAYLLGVVVDSLIKEPSQLFLDENLFAPLGITDYILQTDMTGHLYFAGGMFMLPRDMLKFGQLYLNQGKWNGKTIISDSWIQESFKKQTVLENTEQKNPYGYFWWHGKYTIGKKTVESLEARGAGGQYIFIVPEYDLVVAVTSGNFRNGRYWQPEKILENYILPAIH